jgi:hypothetical protein
MPISILAFYQHKIILISVFLSSESVSDDEVAKSGCDSSAATVRLHQGIIVPGTRTVEVLYHTIQKTPLLAEYDTVEQRQKQICMIHVYDTVQYVSILL